MQLEFVYKNRDDKDVPIKYEIAEGANISMSYNEDLSNGVLIIREDSEINIEPYDEVIVYGLDYVDKLYMLIESYVCKETRNKYNDKQYTYQIKIMSQTKLLENKILPSLAITPKTNGNLSIYAYLERYNNLYGQKVRTATGFANKFVFNTDETYHKSVANKFADVCPELQFNNPTFRECLTQLMMVKNCIPIVQNNVIDYIDLSEKNTLRDKDDKYIAYVETSQSSEDYISSLKTNVKNVIQEDGYTIATEVIGFRSENSSVVNTNNLYLYTQHPIYEILSLKIQGVSLTEYGVYDSFGYIVGDLVSDHLIYEKSKWETLDIVNTLNDSQWRDYPKYQNSTVYYTRGSKIIQNFGLTTKRGWVPIMNACISYLHFYYLNKGGVSHYGAFADDEKNWKGVAFSITYKTKADIVTNLGKNKLQTTEREVVDNQSDNYINAYSFGLLEYAKANRLGNKMKTYSGRFERNYANLPVVGDYYEGNEIIYKIDYQIWQNAVDATIYTCPNYVLRNYFTSVKSQLRSWNIVDGNEAFAREENLKWYLEFDYKEHPEKSNEIVLNTEDFIKYSFGAINNTKIDVPLITAKTIGAIYPDDFIMDTFKNVCGNSLIFTFGYADNYEIARYIINLYFEGGMKQNMYSYVSDNGNFSQIRYSLLKSYVSITGLPLSSVSINQTEFENYFNILTNYSMQQPKKTLHSYTYFLSIARDLYKDNKEIPKINTQFEFCCADNILLGDEFINGHRGSGIPKSQLKIRISDVEPISDILPSGTDIDISNVVINAASNSSTAQMIVNNMPTDKYCYIYNTDNSKVLLGFKGNELWLNLLKDRHKEIYERDANNNLVVKGTI